MFCGMKPKSLWQRRNPMSDAREWLNTPTWDSNGPTWARWARMRDALLAVLDLHIRKVLPGGMSYCSHCWNTNREWPCPTVQAINKVLGVSE